MAKERQHPGPGSVKEAERALRQFERDARMMDLAYMDERLKASGPGLRIYVASELTLLIALISAATWFAIDIVSRLPHQP